jgi:hypothetical protein
MVLHLGADGGSYDSTVLAMGHVTGDGAHRRTLHYAVVFRLRWRRLLSGNDP